MQNLKKIVGHSADINELRGLIKVVGPSDATALILGESGTGKELVARALHDCSDRSAEPFIPVNCGAIPRELLESELFGHRKGAFTGAISDRKGRFELASGGTLFLDEIGDMSMDLQVKLLRVLQERVIDPVGTTQSMAIDVRVIAATHKNIEELISRGEFREDLYYRLNVMPIEIQRLQDRKEDIVPLIEHFALMHVKRKHQPITFATASMDLFMRYSWPGNVRELSNLVNRYSALYPGQTVDFRNVPQSMLPPGIRMLANEGLEGPEFEAVASGQGTFNFDGQTDAEKQPPRFNGADHARSPVGPVKSTVTSTFATRSASASKFRLTGSAKTYSPASARDSPKVVSTMCLHSDGANCSDGTAVSAPCRTASMPNSKRSLATRVITRAGDPKLVSFNCNSLRAVAHLASLTTTISAEVSTSSSMSSESPTVKSKPLSKKACLCTKSNRSTGSIHNMGMLFVFATFVPSYG